MYIIWGAVLLFVWKAIHTHRHTNKDIVLYIVSMKLHRKQALWPNQIILIWIIRVWTFASGYGCKEKENINAMVLGAPAFVYYYNVCVCACVAHLYAVEAGKISISALRYTPTTKTNGLFWRVKFVVQQNSPNISCAAYYKRNALTQILLIYWFDLLFCYFIWSNLCIPIVFLFFSVFFLLFVLVVNSVGLSL